MGSLTFGIIYHSYIEPPLGGFLEILPEVVIFTKGFALRAPPRSGSINDKYSNVSLAAFLFTFCEQSGEKFFTIIKFNNF